MACLGVMVIIAQRITAPVRLTLSIFYTNPAVNTDRFKDGGRPLKPHLIQAIISRTLKVKLLFQMFTERQSAVENRPSFRR